MASVELTEIKPSDAATDNTTDESIHADTDAVIVNIDPENADTDIITPGGGTTENPDGTPENHEATDKLEDMSDDSEGYIITHLPTRDIVSEMQKSQFASVIFHDIPETYTAEIDIECHYTLTSELIPTTRDWVGLYRVGWMSCRDYVIYEWAPIPETDDARVKVVFPKKQLPTDNGEFYQYCYVTRTGQIRGASTPFQFRQPRAEDYVEIEDEDDDLLVIRPSKVVLEEKLRDAEDGHNKLRQVYSVLEQDRDQLRVSVSKLNKELQQEKKARKQL